MEDEIEIVQVDQEDIDTQNKNYSEDYLLYVKAGDYVYDDGEVFAGESCVNHWAATEPRQERQLFYNEIARRLKELNAKS